MSNEYQDKIYIIGSTHSSAEDIKKTADYYISTGRYRVKYVKPSSKPIETLILECFENIIWADRVYIVPKPDGSIGNGVTYEKVFAKIIGKRVEEVPYWVQKRLTDRRPKNECTV